MENPLVELKKVKINEEVLGTIIQNPGVSITELSKKLNQLLPNVSRSLKQLRKLKLVRIELEEGNGGTIKRLYPTMRGHMEHIAGEKEFTEKEIEVIDQFYFHPSVIKTLFRPTSEKEKADPSIMMLKTSLINLEVYKQALQKKDKSFIKAFNEFQKVAIRHMKAFMKL